MHPILNNPPKKQKKLATSNKTKQKSEFKNSSPFQSLRLPLNIIAIVILLPSVIVAVAIVARDNGGGGWRESRLSSCCF